jgi:hypothetical protein
MKLNALYKTAFGESKNVAKNYVIVLAMVTVTFQSGGQFSEKNVINSYLLLFKTLFTV